MGFGIGIIEILTRERSYRGLGDDVLLIGRQTIYCTPKEALEKCAALGINVSHLRIEDIDVDQATTNRKAGFESEPLITDAAPNSQRRQRHGHHHQSRNTRQRDRSGVR